MWAILDKSMALSVNTEDNRIITKSRIIVKSSLSVCVEVQLCKENYKRLITPGSDLIGKYQDNGMSEWKRSSKNNNYQLTWNFESGKINSLLFPSTITYDWMREKKTQKAITS